MLLFHPRNSIVNVGETVVYDAVKDAILSGGHMQEGVPLHLASAMLAGLSATLVASPVDVIKTRCGDDDVIRDLKSRDRESIEMTIFVCCCLLCLFCYFLPG